MTNPSEDLLATTEGIDEGSAASTAESSTEELTGVKNPISRALGDPPRTEPESEATPAPPVDVDTGGGLGADGPGQQLEAGEG